jgi:hypothetical protein
LMASYFVQCQLKTRGLRMLLTTSWLGKMEKFCQNMKIMDSSTCMTSTATCKDPSSTSLVPRLRISKFCQHHRVTPFSFGLKILTILQEKVTTESILSYTSESTKVKIDTWSQSSRTRFKTWNGPKQVSNSSLSQDSNQLWPLCITLMENPPLNLERDSETSSKFVLSARPFYSVDLVTFPAERWTSGSCRVSRRSVPPSLLAHPDTIGQLAVAISWPLSYTKDSK